MPASIIISLAFG